MRGFAATEVHLERSWIVTPAVYQNGASTPWPFCEVTEVEFLKAFTLVK